ncbi:hypothetical protein Tco_1118711, partial [Tanacetum coccineum]
MNSSTWVEGMYRVFGGKIGIKGFGLTGFGETGLVTTLEVTDTFRVSNSTLGDRSPTTLTEKLGLTVPFELLADSFKGLPDGDLDEELEEDPEEDLEEDSRENPNEETKETSESGSNTWPLDSYLHVT